MNSIIKIIVVCVLAFGGNAFSQKSKTIFFAFGCCLEGDFITIREDDKIIFSDTVSNFKYSITGEKIFHTFSLRKGDDVEFSILVYSKGDKMNSPLALRLKLEYSSLENGTIVELSHPKWKDNLYNTETAKKGFLKVIFFQYENKKLRKKLISDYLKSLDN